MGAGSFDITGYAHLAGNKADKYNLSVACDNLDIDSPVFKGPLNATLNVDSMKFVVPGIEEQIIPKTSMSLSEIMTTVIYFHLSNQRTFKWYYLKFVSTILKPYFPKILDFNA